MNSKLTEKRDYLFDNLKALMLFLVVIGHILDPYIERQDSLYRYLMQYIYLFHMPMFAFITGYFTKNTEKARNSAVRNVLVPYIFWQLLYIITALLFIRLGLASYNTDVFKPSLLLPSSPLYYLLCVFVWKVFAADLKKLRFPVLFSFAAGLFISVVFQAQRAEGGEQQRGGLDQGELAERRRAEVMRGRQHAGEQRAARGHRADRRQAGGADQTPHHLAGLPQPDLEPGAVALRSRCPWCRRSSCAWA